MPRLREGVFDAPFRKFQPHVAYLSEGTLDFPECLGMSLGSVEGVSAKDRTERPKLQLNAA